MRHALLGACALALSATAAYGQVCGRGADDGAPIRVGAGPAGFGVVPEVCPVNELSLQGTGNILIAERDFYGSLQAGGSLRLRAALPRGPWFSVWFPGFEYWYVANATVDHSSQETSAGAVGLHWPLSLSRTAMVTPFVRLLVPTETIYEHATRYGVDQGVSATLRLSSGFELAGGFSLPALFTVNETHVHTVYLPSLASDVLFSPWRFLSLGAGVGLRYRAGSDRPLESLEPRTAVRCHFGAGTRLELAAAFPVAGADRTLVVLGAGFGWSWDHPR